MGQPRDFKKQNKWLYHALTKKSLTLKYLHIVAKEDPQARTVGSLVVHDVVTTFNACSPLFLFALNTSPSFTSKRQRMTHLRPSKKKTRFSSGFL